MSTRIATSEEVAKKWKNEWFDAKVNAKAHFETEEVYRTYDRLLGSWALPGALTSGGVIGVEAIAKKVDLQWLAIIKQNSKLSKMVPYLALASLASWGFREYCDYKTEATIHHKAGVAYNILSRKISDGLSPDHSRSSAQFEELRRERDAVERDCALSASNRMASFARGLVLASKFEELTAPSALWKYVGPSPCLGEVNKKFKAELLERPLNEWNNMKFKANPK
mmetsp:Transcript_9577/g.29520  ORF Transcript_9577/g.29520 Transcript_9577/m.29520 type:complete len:224 (+) Transcript_9577:187-858(+)